MWREGMMRFEQCRAVSLVDERQGYGTAGMFEFCEIVPFIMNACEEPIFFFVRSMRWRFGLCKNVWSVAFDEL